MLCHATLDALCSNLMYPALIGSVKLPRCTIRRKAHAISSSECIHTSSSFAGGSKTNGGSKPPVDTQLQHQELMPQLSLLEFKVNINISISSSSIGHINKAANKCHSKHSWRRRSIQDLVDSCQVLVVKQVQWQSLLQ